MDPVQLYRTIHQTPFKPWRVFLKDGRTYDLPFRGLAVVGETYLDIGIQAQGEKPGIVADIITVPLKDIDRLEPLVVAEPWQE